MKTIWLASTALLITAGSAFAQSNQTAAPAPTGAVSSPQVTPSGAPGNMAPAPGKTSMSSITPSATTPAPNGAVSAPDVTAGAAPGTAPGKMGTGTNSMASTASDSAISAGPTHIHHHWSSTTTLPQNASATTYLHIAKSAIWHHNTALADDALSHAETQLLNRSVPQGQIAADDSPSVQSIESARQALKAGNYSQASTDTKKAASAVSGM